MPGPRQATADEAVRQSGERFYASHNWHPFFLQGTKLIAYEIWEELGFTAPDAVADADRRREPRAGLLDRLRRAAARGRRSSACRDCWSPSPRNCSPLASAFAHGAHDASRTAEWRPTIAEGTSIARPVRDRRGARGRARRLAARSSRSLKRRSRPAVRTLAALGLYAEPTSALVVAALDRLPIEPGEIVVTVLTGSGLKAANTMSRILDR